MDEARKYCTYCGQRLKEKWITRCVSYDRSTGKKETWGAMHLVCPNGKNGEFSDCNTFGHDKFKLEREDIWERRDSAREKVGA